ncbi:hypothetical protein [Nonomuraea rubra]|uniref:hypothetical protein n=1 Tax=Nonomuraea rubra TaxID=46180 RepID=UPI003410DDE8
MLPFVSLDAVRGGYGIIRDLEGAYKTHTIQVSVSGPTASFQVMLQGSLDGVTWVNLDSTMATGLRTVSTHYVRYVRAWANLQPEGTAVTVAIASA